MTSESTGASIAAAPQPSPTAQADSQPAPELDMAVMQLAESVGLIGPASRVGDLHAAIQRFHDLICVNATIKAAVMAADVISGAATSVRDYPPLPMQFACSGVFPVYSADQMRAYVDADRAARAAPQPATADARPFPAMVDGLLCLCTSDSSGTIWPLNGAATLPIPLSWKAAVLESWAAQREIKP